MRVQKMSYQWIIGVVVLLSIIGAGQALGDLDNVEVIPAGFPWELRVSFRYTNSGSISQSMAVYGTGAGGHFPLSLKLYIKNGDALQKLKVPYAHTYTDIQIPPNKSEWFEVNLNDVRLPSNQPAQLVVLLSGSKYVYDIPASLPVRSVSKAVSLDSFFVLAQRNIIPSRIKTYESLESEVISILSNNGVKVYMRIFPLPEGIGVKVVGNNSKGDNVLNIRMRITTELLNMDRDVEFLDDFIFDSRLGRVNFLIEGGIIKDDSTVVYIDAALNPDIVNADQSEACSLLRRFAETFLGKGEGSSR
jgi:hypothetical protein